MASDSSVGRAKDCKSLSHRFESDSGEFKIFNLEWYLIYYYKNEKTFYKNNIDLYISCWTKIPFLK